MNSNYKRLWIPFDVRFLKSKYEYPDFDGRPYESDDARKIDKEISELLKNGWSIASTSPVTGTSVYVGSSQSGGPTHYTYTMGIEVFMVKSSH